MKLQHLEVNSQTESKTEQKRIPKKTIYRDYEVFREDSDDNIPTISQKKVFTFLENVAIGTPVTAKQTIVNKCTELKTNRKIPNNTEFIDNLLPAAKTVIVQTIIGHATAVRKQKIKRFTYSREIFLKEKTFNRPVKVAVRCYFIWYFLIVNSRV